MQDDSLAHRSAEESLKYVLSCLRLDRKLPIPCRYLFLCDDLRERDLLAQLLHEHIEHRDPRVPVISLKISGHHGLNGDVAVILHTAARRWLGESPFDSLSLKDLTSRDLISLSEEVFERFDEEATLRQSVATFVIVLADVEDNDTVVSTLGRLRGIIQDRMRIAWFVFAPRSIGEVNKRGLGSPFHNIFRMYELQCVPDGNLFLGRIVTLLTEGILRIRGGE